MAEKNCLAALSNFASKIVLNYMCVACYRVKKDMYQCDQCEALLCYKCLVLNGNKCGYKCSQSEPRILAKREISMIEQYQEMLKQLNLTHDKFKINCDENPFLCNYSEGFVLKLPGYVPVTDCDNRFLSFVEPFCTPTVKDTNVFKLQDCLCGYGFSISKRNCFMCQKTFCLNCAYLKMSFFEGRFICCKPKPEITFAQLQSNFMQLQQNFQSALQNANINEDRLCRQIKMLQQQTGDQVDMLYKLRSQLQELEKQKAIDCNIRLGGPNSAFKKYGK